MKQKLLNKLWLRATMLVALMCVAFTNVWADETITFADLGLTNGAQYTDPFDGGDFTVTFAGGANDGKYYNTGSGIRVYGGGTMTIASEKTIESITITYDGSYKPSDGNVVIVGTYDASTGVWTGSATEIVFTRPSGSGHWRVKSVSVTYAAGGGGDDPVLLDNDLALTGAPIALNFDLYNNATAQTIHYTTSSTGEVSVEAGKYDVSCYVDEDAKTITVTPFAMTNGLQTVTVNQAADENYKAGSVTFTVTVTDSTPIVTHTATFSVNGETSTEEYEEGADIVFPANPSDVSGKTFVGWVAEAIDGTTDEAPSFVTSATMGDSDVTFYAVFAYASGSGSAEVTDVLNRELTGVTSTSYYEWSDVTATSSAVYSGQSAGGNNAIQLRSSNNNSGIVTTTSGGKVTKVVITWNSNTADGRTVNVYGKNSAYSDATDLYNSTNQGTLIGTIVCGTSTELAVDDDYEYMGFRSASGALYLDEVEITWSTGGDVSYSDYCTTVVAAAVERPVIEVAENPFLFSTTATITCETEGAAIYYRYSEEEEWVKYEGALTITTTTTIYAKAVKGDDESSVVSVTATKNLAEPIVAIDATGITNTDVYYSTEAGNLSASVTYNEEAVEGATVTWSSNNEAVATIDENGVVTLVAVGSVTFTATYAGNDDYSEKSATYEMTVTNTDPNVPGTENNPYTVAEAVEFIGTLGTAISATEVYVSGIISQIDSYNSTYHSIQYWISDDGTTTGQMEVYSGKGLDGADFSSVDDLKVGDIVTVKGYVKMYKGTPEFDKNNIIVSFERPVVTTPSIEVSTTTVEAPAAGLEGTIEVTYNNITDVAAEVYFCDAEGNEATYDWVVADINGSNNVDYVIDENTSTEARTAYMKVYALDDETNDVYSELITITQAGYVVDYATLPFVWDDKSTPTGVTNYGVGTYSSSPYLKFDGSGDEIILKLNEEPGVLFFDIKGNSFSGGTFTVQTSDDGLTYEDLATYTELGATQTEAFSLDADVRYIKWVYTEKVTGNVALGNIIVDKVQVASVGAVGYATYVSNYNVSFPEGVEAYITSVVNKEEGYVSMTQVTAVPKGTPVVLKGEGTHTLAPAAGALDDVSGNELKASDGSVVTGGTQYVLAKPADKEIGFYKAATGGTIAAGKAYLEISDADVKGFTFLFGDEATGLSTIDNGQLTIDNAAIYNLAGQRIQKMQKGINIVNGKKIAIK